VLQYTPCCTPACLTPPWCDDIGVPDVERRDADEQINKYNRLADV